MLALLRTPQMENCMSKNCITKKIIMPAILLILFKINSIFAEQLPWDRWMLDKVSPEPGISRRHMIGKVYNIPYKAPNFNCECPPNKECKLDFEIDEEALDFLKLHGIVKKHEEAQLKQHMSVGKKKTIRKYIYSRRAMKNGGVPQEQCCCPPITRAM
ncbi:uncharacterized protein LOC134755080 [Cydia strobilella]|uniref:uncharacterized protein LOC134755080 n=1 Tax=Cydia strobilella TaxID=1100964 RepID=UPI003005B635